MAVRAQFENSNEYVCLRFGLNGCRGKKSMKCAFTDSTQGWRILHTYKCVCDCRSWSLGELLQVRWTIPRSQSQSLSGRENES